LRDRRNMKGAKRPLQLRRTDHTRNTRAAAATAERSAFLSDEPAFARLLRRSSRAGGAAGYLLAALAAATILSKRGSPRKESSTD
jgi:hypothetical protein